MSNRAERRRQLKQGIKLEKEKTYTLTESQIKQMEVDMYKDMYKEAYKQAYDYAYDNAYNDAISVAYGLMLNLPIKILRDKHWKKSPLSRIKEFAMDCINMYESLVDENNCYKNISKEVEQLLGEDEFIMKRLQHAREKFKKVS